MNPGLAYAALAYVAWGLFPLYFAQLAHVSPFEVVLQRTLWSLLVLLAVLALLRRWAWLKPALAQPRLLALSLVSALLLAANWTLYVWAVHQHRVVDASLGYFINPLVSVLLGVLVLRERLRPAQWVAVALAALGVAWLTWRAGQLPWIALVLAASFGLYGLMRKTAPLGALEGLTVETALLAPLAAGLLWWMGAGQGLVHSTVDWFWLALSGPLTVLALVAFAAGARRLPLATLGLMQYVSPTLQLALGVWVFHEPFDGARLAGFALIWAALALYSLDAWRSAAPQRPR